MRTPKRTMRIMIVKLKIVGLEFFYKLPHTEKFKRKFMTSSLRIRMKKNLSKSKELYESVKDFVVRGVHTNFKYMHPHPIYFQKAKGSKIWDADNNEFIDCVMNFGPCILGHGHPKILEAVKNQLETGLTVGLETELNIKVAKKLVKMVPSAEMVRLSTTGTEAVMHAIHIARAYTGKNKIIKIEGGYNGWYDDILVSYRPPLKLAGPETLPTPIPDSGGIQVKDTLVIPFNNEEVAEKIIKKNKEEVAALIMEPIMLNIGCALPKEGYLQAIREITEESDVLLIFDEVRTGFRIAPGGAQQHYGVLPDLTVLAKAIANGFPLSAVVGKKDVMEVTDPIEGRVMYAGTYNANQMSVAAASVTLEELSDGSVQRYLNESTQYLIKRFDEIAEAKNVSARIQGIGGSFQVYFTDSEVIDYRSTFHVDASKYMKFQKVMFDQNIYFWPNHLFCHCISATHNKEDIEKIVNAMELALSNSD
jgi:glutamate-1-semialdehyde 2,1-aminomutase